MGPEMPDVERNGFTFTDGVGFAGRAVLAEAARALGHTRGLLSQPSAIQFRLGLVATSTKTEPQLTVIVEPRVSYVAGPKLLVITRSG